MRSRRSLASVAALLVATVVVGAAAAPASASTVATSLSGLEGNATITLSWTKPDEPPSSGDASKYTILGYTVSVFDASTKASLGTVSCTHASGTPQSCVISSYTKADKTTGSLANGTGYTFNVVTQWLNSNVDPAEQVDTDPSSSSSTLTPYTTPDAPTGVVGAASGTQATVTFTAPSNDGGRSVTDYTVITYLSDGVTKVNSATLCTGSATGSTASRTVCSLSSNTKYKFKVKATNARGDSVESNPSAVMTTIPAAPTKPSAAIDSSGATSDIAVTWTGVSGDGTVTKYEVLPFKNGTAQDSQVQTWESGTLSVSFIGTSLDLGSSYTFKVRAKNSEGWGEYSEASDARVASTKPATPSAPNATDAGTGDKATLTWSAPAANGADITAYTVTAYTAAAPNTLSGTCSPDSLSSLTCDISGLTTVSTGYYFKVAATNSRGNSAQSASSSTLIIAEASSGSPTTSPTTSSTTVPGQPPATTTTVPAPPPQTTTTTVPSLLKSSAGTPVSVRKPAKTIAQDAAAAVSKQKMTLALKAPITSGAAAITKYVITFKTTTKGAKSITKTVAVKAGKVYTVAVTGGKAAKYQIVVVAYTKAGKKSTWSGPTITTSK